MPGYCSSADTSDTATAFAVALSSIHCFLSSSLTISIIAFFLLPGGSVASPADYTDSCSLSPLPGLECDKLVALAHLYFRPACNLNAILLLNDGSLLL